MLRDKQSGRADEHLLNNKTPENIKKGPDCNPIPATNLLLKYCYYVVVICIISLVTDNKPCLSCCSNTK